MKKFWIALVCIVGVSTLFVGGFFYYKYIQKEPYPFTATPHDTFVELFWNAEKNAAYYTISRSTQNFPTTKKEGVKIYQGNGIELTGVQSDRNLDNGTTYYYTLFCYDKNGHQIKSYQISAVPMPERKEDLVLNGDFSNNLSGWTHSQSGSIVVKKSSDPSIGYFVKMSPNAMSSSFVLQKLTGLKPQTLYSCTVETFTNSVSIPPTFSISGGIQQQQQLRNLTPPPRVVPQFGFGPITYSYADTSDLNKWQKKGFVFYTGSHDPKGPNPFDGTVTLSLIAPRSNDSNAYVSYARVQVVEGLMPYYYPTPIVPGTGENLIQNPTYKGKPPKDWSLSNATVINERITPKKVVSTVKLNPSSSQSAEGTQISPFELALSGSYRFSCLVKVDPGKIAYIYVYDKYTNEPLFTLPISSHLADGNWHTVTKAFQTNPFTRVQPKIIFSAYKQQGDGWHASFAKPNIPAIGGEVVPDPYPIPKMQLAEKTYEFDRGFLDPNSWLVLNQKGSYPSNISFTTTEGSGGQTKKVMKLTAYGNKAPKEKQMRGAVVMTKNYYASGRYDVYMKIGNVYLEDGSIDPNFKARGPLGCCFAIWPFSYITYADTNNQKLYDEPNPIRNTEIDIEIPGALPKGAQNFSFQQGRLNTWGGQRGGDGGNIELHRRMPQDIDPLDGKMHQYTIVWHSGTDEDNNTRTPGFVKWYVDTGEELNDENLWGEWYGSSYGFDNIPYRCARLNLGCWFPIGSYNDHGVWVPSWAGTPSWYSTEFLIEKVIYSPLTEEMLKNYPMPNRDRYEAETNPTHYWHEVSLPSKS